MVDALKSFIPPNAAVAWATKNEILVQVPSKTGPAYICRYRKSTHGLAEALNVLLENEAPQYSLDQPIKDRPVRIAQTKQGKIKRQIRYSDEMREKARAILKKRGVIP